MTNAYIRPIVDRYLRHLNEALTARGIAKDLFVMQSNGGLISPYLARDFPVRIIESGPAAGILMCAIVGKEEGRDQIITFDMGGTTAKLGAIDDGAPAIMPTFEVDLVRYKQGQRLADQRAGVEMIEIGAGGGSIARNDKGMISVGPDSAGADPGPICYGRGGSEPTITDANVVLGYISPDWFNGGAMRLDKQAAAGGIKRAIADPLGVSHGEAAWGFTWSPPPTWKMRLRIVSVERGRDPRRYAMVAFGGAGPLHAARLARAVGIPTVIVPYGAGVGSAMGLLRGGTAHRCHPDPADAAGSRTIGQEIAASTRHSRRRPMTTSGGCRRRPSRAGRAMRRCVMPARALRSTLICRQAR